MIREQTIKKFADKISDGQIRAKKRVTRETIKHHKCSDLITHFKKA